MRRGRIRIFMGGGDEIGARFHARRRDLRRACEVLLVEETGALGYLVLEALQTPRTLEELMGVLDYRRPRFLVGLLEKMVEAGDVKPAPRGGDRWMTTAAGLERLRSIAGFYTAICQPCDPATAGEEALSAVHVLAADGSRRAKSELEMLVGHGLRALGLEVEAEALGVGLPRLPGAGTE